MANCNCVSSTVTPPRPCISWSEVEFFETANMEIGVFPSSLILNAREGRWVSKLPLFGSLQNTVYLVHLTKELFYKTFNWTFMGKISVCAGQLFEDLKMWLSIFDNIDTCTMRNKRWKFHECNLVTFQTGLCQRVTRYGDENENQNPAREIHYVVPAHWQLASAKWRVLVHAEKAWYGQNTELFTSALIGQYSSAHAQETTVRGRCIIVIEF